jgi:hypothetical protein
MNRVRTTVAAAVVVSGLLLPVACSSSSKSATSTTTTAKKDSSKSFEITTPDGQVSISLDGKLPPGWPAGFPVPSGATPSGSGSLGGSSKTVMVGVFTSTNTPDSDYNFYKSSSDVTVESASSLGSGDKFVGSLKLSGTYAGRVTTIGYSGTNYIIVILDSSGTSDTTGGATATTGVTP